MPNQIERDVYVLSERIKNPIEYVRATNTIPIIFHFRDYTIPSGATAEVFVQKPSGLAVYNTAAISGNDVIVDVTTQMFVELGISEIQVQLTNQEDNLVTFSIPVKVRPNYTEGDATESQNESSLIHEIQEAIDEAETATTEANQAAQAANEAAEAVEGAVGGVINDDQVSNLTTYSSQKLTGEYLRFISYLPENGDVNDYINRGHYYASTANAPTLSNAPFQYAFHMTVMSTSLNCVQIAYRISQNESKIRVGYDNGAGGLNWTPWEDVLIGYTFPNSLTISKADPYLYFSNEGGGGDDLGIHFYGTATGQNTFGIYDRKNVVHLLKIAQNTKQAKFAGDIVDGNGNNLSDLADTSVFTVSSYGLSIYFIKAGNVKRIKITNSPSQVLETISQYINIATIPDDFLSVDSYFHEYCMFTTTYVGQILISGKNLQIGYTRNLVNGNSENIPAGVAMCVDFTYI